MNVLVAFALGLACGGIGACIAMIAGVFIFAWLGDNKRQ
jgi:hypothetical protein